MSLIIRVEEQKDHRIVEELTRDAFWDGFQPGADEHYLLHILRGHTDCVQELNLVLEEDGEILGHIIYSRSRIVSASDPSIDYPVVTFGPVSVKNQLQRTGYGQKLIRASIEKARALGFEAIVIYGDPRYYHRFGFRCGDRFDIHTHSGQYAVGLQVLPLQENTKESFFQGKFAGQFHESECFSSLNPEDIEAFDSTFPVREKREGLKSQQEFQTMISLSYSI